MDNLLHFPSTTIVNRVVPKIEFYRHSSKKTWFKDLLTREVDSITWLYKLTAETLNIDNGKNIKEIDIFLCQMKGTCYSINSFREMDELLPRHTMFIIKYGKYTDLLMHHKEKTIVRNGEEKWKCQDTELLKRVELSSFHFQLIGTSLDFVYAGLIGQVSNLKTHSIMEYERAAALRKHNLQLQKQLEILERKCRNEKQPRQKYELYQQILKIKGQLFIYETNEDAKP